MTDVFKGDPRTNLRMKLRSSTIMFLLRTVLASPFRRAMQHHSPDIPSTPEGSPEFWLKLMISMCLVLAGGVFAGWICIFWIRTYLTIFIYSDFLCRLTLGLMGLDELHLRVLAASSDNPKEKVNARKGRLHIVFQRYPLMNAWLVLNIMQKGRHWVLVVCLRHIKYIFA